MAGNSELNVTGTPEAVTPVTPIAAPARERPVAPRPETAAQETIPQPPVEEFTKSELRQIASALGDAATIFNRAVRFEIDESTDQLITKIINKETNEVIRQIPPEELIRAAARLRDFIGLLFDIEI